MSIELNFSSLLDELNLVKNLELKTYLIVCSHLIYIKLNINILNIR
jgi:hypothetical protein